MANFKSDSEKDNIEGEVSFRDRIATVDSKGKRKWIFAQKPKGKYYNARTLISLVFFLLFLGLPFVHVKGNPIFLFNIPNAKFILFGKIFWPQDFFILGLTMVTFVIFIILFTASFGRLFCGWVCPQTIFMEMVFRKIEYFIDGSAGDQRLLTKEGWTARKISKRIIKHIVFYILSFIIANFFLSYIIGMKELYKIITEPVSEHIVGLMSIMIFSAVFYAVYAFFREQACTVVCPYGRLQSVLLDRNSMIVAYDYKRGEPRGKFSKKANADLGDCIDCFQCVKVCPTGIDIRNGLQMECVGCTACIDACDAIMEKTGRQKGLIRYASENGIENGEKLKYTIRMKLYTLLLSFLLILLTALMLTRKDIGATILRAPGMLAQERGTDTLSNLYNITVVNKTTKNIPLTLKLEGTPGRLEVVGANQLNITKEGQGEGSFFIVLPRSIIRKRTTVVKVGLYNGEKKIDEISTHFFGYPNN